MSVTLKPEERDALFLQIDVQLDLMGDFQMAMKKGNEEECYLLGRRISDALRLVIDGGIGWRRTTVGPTVLALPPGEITPIMNRIRTTARAAIEAKRPDHEESQAEWDELVALNSACKSALDQARSS